MLQGDATGMLPPKIGDIDAKAPSEKGASEKPLGAKGPGLLILRQPLQDTFVFRFMNAAQRTPQPGEGWEVGQRRAGLSSGQRRLQPIESPGA